MGGWINTCPWSLPTVYLCFAALTPSRRANTTPTGPLGGALLHKHGLGLVCVLPFHPEHFLDCSEGPSNPAFLQFEDNQPCSSSR